MRQRNFAARYGRRLSITGSLVGWLTLAGLAQARGPQADSTPAELLSDGGAFVENVGQWPGETRFRATRGELAVWVTESGFVLDLHGQVNGRPAACALSIELQGGTAQRVCGEVARPAVRHFLRGGRAPLDARAFERVRLVSPVEGVDLVLRRAGTPFEYDLELAPGAELEALEFRVEGARSLCIAPDGALELETAVGILRQSPPVSWTVNEEGQREPLACRFVLRGEMSFSFIAPTRDPAHALVVDPGLHFGSYVGSLDFDLSTGVAVAPNGEIVVVGATSSTGFPVTRGAYDHTLSGSSDGFLIRVTPDGSETLSATFFGGSGSELVAGVAIGPGGEIAVAGETRSADFPVTPGAYDNTYNGGADAFVALFDSDAANLIAATFLGHTGDERAEDVGIDGSLRVTVCGSTNSTSFPTTLGAYDGSYNFGGDAFVSRFAPGLGVLDDSTFLGGTAWESALSLALSPGGEVTVGGITRSLNFPTTAGAFDTTAGGGAASDGFVSRLNPAGSQLSWSTYFGGAENDEVRGVALHTDGAVALVGTTQSDDLPTTAGAAQTSHNGFGDAFVAGLSATGATLEMSTYLGGDDLDRAHAVAVDAAGFVVAVGAARSADFPVTPWAFDASFNGLPSNFESDVFIVRVAPDASLDYSSYLGGSNDEEGFALALDSDGTLLIAGQTNSSNFPTPGGFDTSYDFSTVPDGFVARVDFLRYPFAYGSGKLNSMGWVPTIGAGFASLADGQHTIFVDLCVPHEAGWFFRGTGQAQIPFMGGDLWVAPPLTRLEMVQTDLFGAASTSVSILPSMVGTTGHYQFWQVDPGDAFGVGLTAGVEVTYYP